MLPPIEEQHEIVAFLNARLTEFDILQVQCELGVETLQERRSALISAAVTGQIDVRGLVPEVAAA
jgi:type I restriction enzyme S subunit